MHGNNSNAGIPGLNNAAGQRISPDPIELTDDERAELQAFTARLVPAMESYLPSDYSITTHAAVDNTITVTVMIETPMGFMISCELSPQQEDLGNGDDNEEFILGDDLDETVDEITQNLAASTLHQVMNVMDTDLPQTAS